MRRMVRLLTGLAAALMFGALSPHATLAQHDPNNLPILNGFEGTCWITGANERLNVFVRACNDTEGTLFGVTSSLLNIETTDTATFDFLTIPGFRRELVVNNCVTFKWQGRVAGCGVVDIFSDVTAEDEARETFTTGELFCGRVENFPDECVLEPPTPTRTPVRVPTLRPTRTPLPLHTRQPTATPRTRLATPTPKPPPQRATLRPTRTPLNTPTPRPAVPTHTRPPTPSPRPALATPTRKPGLPTQPPNPTRTRTPLPTARPFCPSCLRAECIAIPANNNTFTAFLTIFNETGYPITDIVPNAIELDPIRGATIVRTLGPFPATIPLLLDAHSARFRWDVTTGGTGQVFIHVSASGVGNGGTLLFTGSCETNTINVVNSRTS